ncbi:MAG: TIGR04282 family arsenosugar biosynthesis glycosyltransferase [Candidatus Bathyarchaeota archaeon]|nr:TIGR04282 family arsenosugar biosynthesis glycosyltransferase [Candidatus Bathyarchaeota archaeon]
MPSSYPPCLLLLVKYPLDSYVKTRLAQNLDPHLVSELYKALVEDILVSIKETQLPLRIYYSPNHMLPHFLKWLGTEHLFLPQKGKHLGDRLKHGIQSTFNSGFTSVIALASDVPDLTPHLLCAAAKALEHSDIVIGPCHDGGYYLIGFTQTSYHPLYLTNMPWSTSDVFTQTLNIAEQAEANITILPQKRDIDTLHDLQLFIQGKVNTRFRSSNTGSFIHQHLQSLFA